MLHSSQCLELKLMSLPPANEVWGKVIFLHLSVILFTGGSTWVRTPPGRYTTLGRYTPLDMYSPLGMYTPGQLHPPPYPMVNARAVRILLECILVDNCIYFIFKFKQYKKCQQCLFCVLRKNSVWVTLSHCRTDLTRPYHITSFWRSDQCLYYVWSDRFIASSQEK